MGARPRVCNSGQKNSLLDSKASNTLSMSFCERDSDNVVKLRIFASSSGTSCRPSGPDGREMASDLSRGKLAKASGQRDGEQLAGSLSSMDVT